MSSRYYNPEWCRWISPDDIEYLDPELVNGLNLYCYCLNNPIMYADPSGHSAILIGLIIGAIVGATIGFGAATMTAGLTITGAQVLTVAGALILAGSLMLMAKDPFIRYLEQGMTEHQKEMFQREIERLKGRTGRKGNDNLDKNILRKIAELIKSKFK